LTPIVLGALSEFFGGLGKGGVEQQILGKSLFSGSVTPFERPCCGMFHQKCVIRKKFFDKSLYLNGLKQVHF
jgi:hypothetical protein